MWYYDRMKRQSKKQCLGGVGVLGNERKRQMKVWAGALCVCGNAIQGDNSTLTAHDGIHDWWRSIAASSIFSCNENKIHLFLPLCLLKSMWETSPPTLTRARCGPLMYFSICLSLSVSLSPSVGQKVMNSSLAADVKTDCGSELLLLFDCYRNMAQSLKECSANVHAISQFNSLLSRLKCEIQAPPRSFEWISVNKHFSDISAWFYILLQI